MIQLRPVLLIVGVMIGALGVAMTPAMIADLAAEDAARRADWTAFAASGIICLALGGAMAAANWGRIEILTPQQGFLLITLIWVALAVFGALPFVLGTEQLSYTDAFFETMSGFTTTGATVVVGLDDAPPGFLLWRALSQWFGGVGVVIMAIAALPMLRVGGMQLFRLESSDTSEKILPRARQIATAVTVIYLVFTGACYLAYWLGGMTAFDALAHALTTVSTGGFSTKDASFGYFLTGPTAAAPLDLVAVVFMLAGALPFSLYIVAFRGRPGRFLADSQVRFFLYAVFVFVSVMTLALVLARGFEGFTAFRYAGFNIVSILTGTGYATTDYGQWGPLAVVFFFCIAFVGGCAGSTSCGLKIFRLQIALAALRMFARRLAHPHGVFVARYNGRPLDDEVFVSVMSFFFIYFATFSTAAVILSAFGMDPITALSSAASAIANVGPGRGPEVGPAGNFASQSDAAKWTLAIVMLLGRLEFLSVFVLFTPAFWRR